MQQKTVKTFKEIDDQLKSDLAKINLEITEMENFLEIGNQMLRQEMEKNPSNPQVVEKYKQDIANIENGISMFVGIRAQIEQTIQTLHETVKKAEEHIIQNGVKKQ